MKISLKWLSNYLDIDPIQKNLNEVLAALTMRGLEVESVQNLSKGFDKVIIGQIEVRDKHPNADRLSVCKVNTGSEVLQIVCGAQNMKAKDKVAVSMIGALLPNGLKIEKGKIRDVESFGMLCSETELGIAESSEGILILPSDAPVGKPLAPFIGRDDIVFEVNVTPNRGDALSHLGVARELAAVLGQKVKFPDGKVVEKGKEIKSSFQAQIESNHCLQYRGRYIEGVKVAPSPKWLQERLLSVGLRPINNIVDVTNFVLMEYGQPLHAFDAAKISKGKIIVRQARAQEKLLLLNQETVELVSDDMVIADGEKPIALAGVMGGGNSEVTEKTTDVFLEAAEFKPASVRKTSRRLALHSDSSHRFERGIDASMVASAMNRAASLIAEVAGGSIAKGEISVQGSAEKPASKEISFELASCNQALGLNLTADQVGSCLKQVGFELLSNKSNTLKFSIPGYRNDVEIKEDLFEEVLRVWGYDKVPALVPAMAFIPAPSNSSDLNARKLEKLKAAFAAHGFSETVNFAFTSHAQNQIWGGAQASKAVQLQNPLNEEFTVMKTSLLGGLFSNLIHALHHQERDLKLFEVRKVYFLDAASETGVREEWKVAGMVIGRSDAHGLQARDRDLDFYDLKGFVETALDAMGCQGYRYQNLATPDQRLHPTQSIGIAIGKGVCGFLGRLHPRIEAEHKIRKPVFTFEFSLDNALSVSQSSKKFKPIAKFPKVDRDLSLVVPNAIGADKVLNTIQKAGKPLLNTVEIVDLYTGDKIAAGMKSLSVSFSLINAERTMEDKEVEAVCQKILQELKKEYGIELRAQ